MIFICGFTPAVLRSDGIRKAKLIEEDLAKLKEFESVTLDKYIESIEIRLQVERLLERIIGRILDINYHVLKEEFGFVPQDYYKSFIQLGEKGVIDTEFAEEIAVSTGLRNALAHEYDAIDDTQVYSAIKKCLSQVPKYLEIMLTKYSG